MIRPARFLPVCSLFSVAGVLAAAVQTVCPSSYGTCTYTDLQVALSAVSCGTELDIAPIVWTGNFYYQNNCSGNPVVLTSMRKEFLPLAGERLSPSHYYNAVPGTAGSAGNIPVLNSATTTAPLQVYFPTRGLHFIGIGFTTSATGPGFTYQLINMEPTNLLQTTNSSDDIVIDRCYVSGPETAITTGSAPTKVDVQTGIFVLGSNVTVENSTIKDIMYRGFESHGIAGSDAVGPVSYINNFISGAGIPIFSGGNQPRFWPTSAPNNGVVPNGFTAQFNYLYKPYKWWADPVNNPYYYDYLAFGSYEPCVKNLGENKNGQNILWQFNVHENEWINSTECQGQSFGFTFTPRAESGSWSVQTNATTTGDTLTWTGTPVDENGNPPQSKEFACIYGGAYFTCRWIQSVNLAQQTLTIYNDPVTGTGFPTVSNSSWMFGWDASESVQAATIQHDVFRNVNKLFNFQAMEINPDSSAGTTNYGTTGAVSVSNMNINNNLWTNTRLMCWGHCATGSGGSMWGINVFNSEEPYEPATRSVPSGITFNHNTFYVADALGPSAYWFTMQFGSWSGVYSTPLDKFSFNNNILPPSSYGYVRADSFANWQFAAVLATYQTSNAQIKNNSLPGAALSNPCTGGQACTGNLITLTDMDAQFANPAAGVLKVASTSPLAKAGSDGLDIGANFDQLALINGLIVSAGSWSAQIDWDLTSANNSVPCVVEVSPSRNLFSGLGPYTVVDALNPVYFLQPDTDQLTNPKLVHPIISGTHRTFVVGQKAIVADDNDGTQRNLALNPGTLYWGRLMCGGDTRTFSFSTANVPRRFQPLNTVSVSLKLQAPRGASQASMAYGTDESLGQLLTVTPDSAGNVEFQVPTTPGVTTFYQISFLTDNGLMKLPIASF